MGRRAKVGGLTVGGRYERRLRLGAAERHQLCRQFLDSRRLGLGEITLLRWILAKPVQLDPMPRRLPAALSADRRS